MLEELFSEDELRQEIEEIENHLTKLNDSKVTIEKEAQIHLKKREIANNDFKKLKNEAAEYKNKRDLFNQKVKELKLKRENLKKDLLLKRDEIQKEINLLIKLKEHLPNNFINLKKEQEKLEWDIQTNPLSKQKEQQLIERIREIEYELEDYIRMNELKIEISKKREDIKFLQKYMKSFYEEQIELSKKSDIYHEKLLKKYLEIEKFRNESSNAHEIYKECQDKIFQIKTDSNHKIMKVKELKKKLYEILKLRQMEKDNDFKKNSMDSALKKLKKERKMTLEELKIIIENKKFPKD